MKEKTTPALTRFNFDGHGPLTVFSWNGQPAWIAQEVIELLNLKQVHPALLAAKLTEGTDFVVLKGNEYRQLAFASDLKSLANLEFSPKTRNLALLFESGLYSLIMRSRKPMAVKFRNWVTREVLPALRNQGFYSLPGKVQYRDWNGVCRLFGQSTEGDASATRTLAWMGFTPQGDVPVEYRVTPPPMILSKLVELAQDKNPYAVNYLGNILHIPLPPELQLGLPGMNN